MTARGAAAPLFEPLWVLGQRMEHRGGRELAPTRCRTACIRALMAFMWWPARLWMQVVIAVGPSHRSAVSFAKARKEIHHHTTPSEHQAA